MPPILPASRRSLLLQGAGVVIASSLPLGWGAARAQAAALRPTPSQTDEAGHYHHPGDGDRADAAFQGFGQVTLARDGRFRFRTLKPAPYTGRTPHIHVKVRLGGRELLTTQFYVQGDPGNARDALWRRLDAEAQAALTRPFVPGPDGFSADYAVVVRT